MAAARPKWSASIADLNANVNSIGANLALPVDQLAQSAHLGLTDLVCGVTFGHRHNDSKACFL
jgi:hypothetical protein